MNHPFACIVNILIKFSYDLVDQIYYIGKLYLKPFLFVLLSPQL
jgi:hypothetical protein